MSITRSTRLALAAALALGFLPASGPGSAEAAPVVSVTVMAASASDASRAIEMVGGSVSSELSELAIATGEVPMSMLDEVRTAAGVRSVNMARSVETADAAANAIAIAEDVAVADAGAVVHEPASELAALGAIVTETARLAEEAAAAHLDAETHALALEAYADELYANGADSAEVDAANDAANAAHDLARAARYAARDARSAADEAADVLATAEYELVKAQEEAAKDAAYAAENAAKAAAEAVKDARDAARAAATAQWDAWNDAEDALLDGDTTAVVFDSTGSAEFDAALDPGSMHNITMSTGAQALWTAGVTGQGVDVAVIDTGVTQTDVLAGGAVAEGPTFASAGATSSLRDLHGHGTHMASIIAGRSGDASSFSDPKAFTGMAPDARIIAVKASDDDGTSSSEHVLEAINWVIANRNTGGRNIRVLNLSMASERAARPVDDALAHAVTAAWDAGIVVVAAAGNDGLDAPLASPGYEPRIITVGSLDHAGTTTGTDDVPASHSSGSTSGLNRPDLWAPGLSVVASLAQNSEVARSESARIIDDRLVRGTGSSQATAVVSGAVALILSDRPELSPDQVAKVLHETALDIEVNGFEIDEARLDVFSAWDKDTGDGKAEGITAIVAGWSAADASALDATFAVVEGPDAEAAGAQWVGAQWVGAQWVGAQWVGAQWVGAQWVGAQWVGARWVDATWASEFES